MFGAINLYVQINVLVHCTQSSIPPRDHRLSSDEDWGLIARSPLSLVAWSPTAGPSGRPAPEDVAFQTAGRGLDTSQAPLEGFRRPRFSIVGVINNQDFPKR